MGELNQLADGVWVRQSEWVWTNSIVVRVQDDEYQRRTEREIPVIVLERVD